MSGHTPGPWAIDGDILLTRADPLEEISFGRVNISHAFTEDEREANRDLIASAPDLLGALERLTSAARGANDGYLDPAISHAEDVIARAKGEA